MLVGWAMSLSLDASPFAAFQTYHGTSFVESVQVILQNHQWGLAISYLGLCILISLPMLRVFMTAILFFKQKEYLMASAATLVMIALIVSFTLGFEI